MKVRLKIKHADGRVAQSSVDPQNMKPTEASMRREGLHIARGIYTLMPLGYSINFELQQGTRKYQKPLFVISNFLSKLMKAIEADKKCACGALILCKCHEKCDKCEPCEAGTKTASVAIDLGERIYTASSKLNLDYDDDKEPNEDNY